MEHGLDADVPKRCFNGEFIQQDVDPVALDVRSEINGKMNLVSVIVDERLSLLNRSGPMVSMLLLQKRSVGLTDVKSC